MFFKQFYVLCIFFVLSGCEKGQDFATLCEENPSICQEFEEDSWCKRERISVGFSNLNHKNDPSEENKFNQLISYESYGKCMQLASKIEHVKLKHKKTMRLGNVNKAQARLKEISEKTKGMKHPSLLYFHWTRYLDNNALSDFLALENTNQLETPSLQFNLATYYAKIDQNKTLNLLYHALELTNKDETVNTEIFKSISTIFADKKKQKQAYIWSKVLVLHAPEDKTVTNATLTAYAKAFDLDHSFLDLVAEHTLKTILEGQFKPPE
jgi:hypothetical protein